MSSKGNASQDQLKELQDKVRRLEEEVNHLEEIISIIPGHVYWKDKNGRLLGCNNEQAASAGLASRKNIVGLRPIDLIDKNLPDAERKKQAKAIEEVDRLVMDGDQTMLAEEVGLRSDGTQGYFISKKVPIHNRDGSVKGLVGVTLDITQQKQLEKQIDEANKSKSRVLIDISEIIRNPLSAILSTADFLQTKASPSKQKECSDIITAAVRKIVSLLNRLKDYVDLEDSGLQSSSSVFNLKELLADFVKQYSIAAQLKQLEFKFDYDESLPKSLEGGSYFIIQALENLLSNALRYTQRGMITLSAKLDSIVDDNHINVRIQVIDTGLGIRNDRVKCLFSMFDRNQENVDFTHAGSDLSLSAKMIQSLGGNISVESELEKGSIFTIVIPLARVFEDESDVTSEGYSLSAVSDFSTNELPQLRKSKDAEIEMLIVEDDLLSQKALKMLLETVYNCIITQAYSVKEGKALAKPNVDMIFVDINLPDGTGLDFIGDYRKRYGYEVPIIAITAHISDEQKAIINEYGTTDILEKPASLEQLVKIIDSYVFYEQPKEDE